MNYFIDNIKYLRKINHLSQIEFGKLFGKNGSTVANWEIGRRSPIVADTLLIADHFHLKVDDLLFTNIASNPDVLTYADDEKELIEAFRSLKATDRKVVISVAKSLEK